MSDLTSPHSGSANVGVPESTANSPSTACARAAPRKPISGRARVSVEGGAARNGRLVDISESGVGILLDDPIPNKKVCMVMGEVLHDGKKQSFGARAVAAYSVLAGTKGFRIGFQFSALDPGTLKVIHDLSQ